MHHTMHRHRATLQHRNCHASDPFTMLRNGCHCGLETCTVSHDRHRYRSTHSMTEITMHPINMLNPIGKHFGYGQLWPSRPTCGQIIYARSNFLHEHVYQKTHTTADLIFMLCENAVEYKYVFHIVTTSYSTKVIICHNYARFERCVHMGTVMHSNFVEAFFPPE